MLAKEPDTLRILPWIYSGWRKRWSQQWVLLFLRKAARGRKNPYQRTAKVPKIIPNSRSSPGGRKVLLASIETSIAYSPMTLDGSVKSLANLWSGWEITVLPAS